YSKANKTVHNFLQNCARFQAEWYTAKWERCSNTCGNGTQTRVVFCSTSTGGGVRVLPNQLCKKLGEKPPTEQDCESKLSCDNWEAGEWGEPERKCGLTKQIREVKCVSPMENSTEGVLEGLDCLPDDRPADEQEVLLEPCQGAEWATSKWSSCEECGSFIQTRRVECVLENGRIYNEAFCAGQPKPETERECENPPQCEHRWFTSEWSTCSVSCGHGFRTRAVFCGKIEINATCSDMVEDSNCHGSKPVEKEACENSQCDKFWLAAPWNKQCPDNACGGLPRKRAVFCYKDGKNETAEDCEEDDAKPQDKDDCNPQACPTDQIDVLSSCAGTEHGCCPDNETAAGADFDGCALLDRENMTTPCDQTMWGCCRDMVTPAFGPFKAGCALFALCNGTEFGCCPGKEKRAQGPNFEGCEVPCDQTEFGCCDDDGQTAKTDESGSGCLSGEAANATLTEETLKEGVTGDGVDEAEPSSTSTVDLGSGEAETGFGSGDGCSDESCMTDSDAGSGSLPDDGVLITSNCEESEHGCCADGITPAKDAEKHRGCPHCRISRYGCCPDGVKAASGSKFKGCEDICTNSTFGCCPDGYFPAQGPGLEGCELRPCKSSKFGCCPGLEIPATNFAAQGCNNCTESAYGCCSNGEDFALGPRGEGCCVDHEFGCCPDNKTLALGQDLAGCPCQTLPYGCCSDNVTPALGRKQFGCTCETSEFGCCSDLLTAALGTGQANCTCNRMAFGCCSDGVTPASGPDSQYSCDCRTSQFGCCPDGRTPATGPSGKGCHCSTMKYGCCQDQRTPAAGPNLLGCPCSATPYGCCSDGVTRATGPRHEGCEDCTKLKFGCCPDGVYGARGSNFEGCPCDSTEFGCCPDRRTPARGLANEGCPEVPCHQTEFGCCPDNTSAKGRNYDGCNMDRETRERYEQRLRQYHDQHAQHPYYPPPTKPPYYEPRRIEEACFQANDRGQCGNWTLVWYYDYKESRCSRFYYGGCGGNDNRFVDEDSCKSLCDESFVSGRTRTPAPTVTDNEVTPSQSSRPSRNPCELPRDTGPCKQHQERYWYNEQTRNCERFVYGGCLGNANNFPTLKACSNRCRVISDVAKCTMPKVAGNNCTDPRPLFRFDYKAQRCEHYKGCTEDNNVFKDYEDCVRTCTHRTLSPNLSDEVCSAPSETGPCTDFVVQWNFDKNTQRCIKFYYGGCEGNSNRFISESECQYFCGVHTLPPQILSYRPQGQPTANSSAPMCEQPREAGPCSSFETRYYFDMRTRSCLQFYYGGCAGNQNNFNTLDDCQRYCGYRYGGLVPPSPPQSTGPFNPRDCLEPKDPGTCSAHTKMYYYNKQDGVCRDFFFTGCGGNRNRFKERYQCEESCKNSQDICQLPTIKGRCGGAYRLWTYDARRDVCKQFEYGGCKGNANRFDSKADCESRCVRRLLHINETSGDFPDKCRLTAEPGSCIHRITKFYFDLQIGKCLPFLYGGCEGNDNRFETLNDCEKECLVPAIAANLVNPSRENSLDEYKQTSLMPQSVNELCNLPSQPGNPSCSTGQTSYRYYFDSHSQRCLRFVFSGCDGNRNNFVSLDKCESVCRGAPTKEGSDYSIRVHHSALESPRRPLAPPAEHQAAQCPPENCGRVSSCRGLGERREVLPNGCVRCRCNHPCDDVHCKADEKCGTELSIEGTYRGVCKPINKPGDCPKLQCHDGPDRRDQCRDDSECQAAQKCCDNGCSRVCVDADDKELSYGEDLEEVVAIEGEAVTLKCPAKIESTPQWTKAGKDVEHDRADSQDDKLIISGVSKEDAGVYLCEDPEEPKTKGRIALKIAVAPTIIRDKPVVEAPLNTTANLTCHVVGGYPRPSVAWKRGETMLPARSSKYRQLPENTLQVLSVTPEDQDLYLCTATNQRGEAMFLVALVIPLTGDASHQERGQALATKARTEAGIS
ncbi:papilin-like, partial [Tropilaelaps mercedesae]